MAVASEDETTKSDYAILETFDEAQWLYVREALAQGLESEVHETAKWIVANAVAREEHLPLSA